MKNNKGVTLTSLIMYIVFLSIVLGILSMIVTSFGKKYEFIGKHAESASQLNKLNKYILTETKTQRGLQVLDVSGTAIEFDDGTVYTFNETDKGIYKDKVKICNNITSCVFTLDTVTKPHKKILKINISIGNDNPLQKEMSYVLKYY